MYQILYLVVLLFFLSSALVTLLWMFCSLVQIHLRKRRHQKLRKWLQCALRIFFDEPGLIVKEKK